MSLIVCILTKGYIVGKYFDITCIFFERTEINQ